MQAVQNLFDKGGNSKGSCSPDTTTKKRIEQIGPLHLADEILSGYIDGNEMRPHIPWFMRWAYPLVRSGEYPRLLKRLSNNLDWYIKGVIPYYPSWLLYLALAVFIAVFSIATRSFGGTGYGFAFFFTVLFARFIAPLYSTDGYALLTQLEAELCAEAELLSS